MIPKVTAVSGDGRRQGRHKCHRVCQKPRNKNYLHGRRPSSSGVTCFWAWHFSFTPNGKKPSQPHWGKRSGQRDIADAREADGFGLLIIITINKGLLSLPPSAWCFMSCGLGHGSGCKKLITQPPPPIHLWSGKPRPPKIYEIKASAKSI